MKLDWEINECRVLKAKVGETTYFVAPGVVGLWNPRKQTIAFDGRAATIWPVEGRELMEEFTARLADLSPRDICRLFSSWLSSHELLKD